MKQDNSILINGRHLDWEEIDPDEFASWRALEEKARELRKELEGIEATQRQCVFRTRQKHWVNYVTPL